MIDTVSIVKSSNDLMRSVKQSVELIGGLNLQGLPAVIKPNLCTTRDSRGRANTSVMMTSAVIDMLLENDKRTRISVVESDSTGKWLDIAFKNNGYTEMVQKYCNDGYDIRLINLSREPSLTVSHRSLPFGDFQIPKILIEPNYFISIARAKTHGLTDITGILKNQFGCLPRKDKDVYHNYIDRVILEINRLARPDLCIVDAITGMEGVIEGELKYIGVLLCGYNPASVDAVLAQIMGFDPEDIKHIVLASRYGLGSIRPNLVGVPIEEVAVKFRRPSRIIKALNRHVPERLRPLVRTVYHKTLIARFRDRNVR